MVLSEAAYRVETANILDWARTYTGPKFHALLCDPPYEIGFMNKGWDSSGIVFAPELWSALMPHLHPGAFCFAFSSTRTVHRMMVAIEDAGFVIHPLMLAWNQSTGFPKASNPTFAMAGIDEAATPTFAGHRYGLQALKPAFEPIVCFQKPYPKKVKPVVSMLETGAGCLNINAGRIGTDPDEDANNRRTEDLGRWPSNVLLCHLPQCKCRDGVWECADGCAVQELGSQSGTRASGASNGDATVGEHSKGTVKSMRRGNLIPRNDTGTASRFYFQAGWDMEIEERLAGCVPVCYAPKPGTKEKDAGLGEGFVPTRVRSMESGGALTEEGTGRDRNSAVRCNTHTTVKPLRLAEYLAKLLLPPAQYTRRLLVPFSGSGSEMIGARQAGWDRVVGVELLPEHVRIANARLAYWETRTTSVAAADGVPKKKHASKYLRRTATGWIAVPRRPGNGTET